MLFCLCNILFSFVSFVYFVDYLTIIKNKLEHKSANLYFGNTGPLLSAYTGTWY